jgi:hypothetical protein
MLMTKRFSLDNLASSNVEEASKTADAGTAGAARKLRLPPACLQLAAPGEPARQHFLGREIPSGTYDFWWR